MSTAAEERLGRVRRRIDDLEAKVKAGADGAAARVQRHLDVLKRDEEAARVSAHRHAGVVDARLEQLDNELDIVEHRLQAELADDRESFVGAVEAELRDWDVALERAQAKAAARAGAARAKLELAVTDLRKRRTAATETLRDVRGSTDDAWRESKARVLAELDALKHKADEFLDE